MFDDLQMTKLCFSFRVSVYIEQMFHIVHVTLQSCSIFFLQEQKENENAEIKL